MNAQTPSGTASRVPGHDWFSERVARAEPLVLLGAFDAVSARLIERAGLEALYCGGYAAVASAYGQPDLGLVTFSETLATYRRIANATTLPMVVDADSGFGGVLNIRRTVEEFASLPVAAVQIQDQLLPKRFGQFDSVVFPVEEATLRVRAAVNAAGDRGPAIIARVDCLAAEGIDAAIDRAIRYVDEGASAIFVSGLRDRDDLMAARRGIPGPLVFNSAKKGQESEYTVAELGDLGFAVVIYPIEPLFAAYAAMEFMLNDVRAGRPVPDSGTWRRPEFDDFNDFLGLPDLVSWEKSIEDLSRP